MAGTSELRPPIVLPGAHAVHQKGRWVAARLGCFAFALVMAVVGATTTAAWKRTAAVRESAVVDKSALLLGQDGDAEPTKQSPREWTCHSYDDAAGQDAEWCQTVDVLDGVEYFFGGDSTLCGGCWCCKRQAAKSSPPISDPAPSTMVSGWVCHDYEGTQDKEWCETVGIEDGLEYRHDLETCGGFCWCCKRKAEPGQAIKSPSSLAPSSSTLTAAPVTSRSTSKAVASTTAAPSTAKSREEPNEPETEGGWVCHDYQGTQDQEWCKAVGIQDGMEYHHGIDKCPGNCWCCKRKAEAPRYVKQMGAKETNSTWKCHDYEAKQDKWWCQTVGSHQGVAYKFNEGGSLCGGGCSCCKRDVQPGDCTPSGESCLTSQCCNQQGMQCYVKSQYWASCQGACAKGDWSCEKLGVRSPQKVLCTWPGEECSLTKQCCNTGTRCVRQNNQTAWCTGGPLPPGWDGTVLGGHREPWQVGKAAKGRPVAGTSLFCLMAVLAGSQEEALVAVAREVKGGIFGCEASEVYPAMKAQFVSQGSWNSWVNTEPFVRVWELVRDDGVYRKHDWTVKVDPDTVFLPARLRQHLTQLRPPAGAPIYVRNSDVSALKFLGAIEVASKAAMDLYYRSYVDCRRSIGTFTGEDGYMSGCFDSIGVGFMTDFSILNTPADMSPCTDQSRVAFHPRKQSGGWRSCWSNAAR